MDLDAERLAAVARVELDAAACDEISNAIHLLIGHLNDLVNADAVFVDLVRDDELVTCYTTASAASELGRSQSVAESMTGDCLRFGAALKSPNVTRDPRLRPPGIERTTYLSLIAVPLHVHGAAVGLVRVVAVAEAFFDDEDMVIARLLTGAMGRTLIQAVRAEVRDEARDQALLSGFPGPEAFEDRRKSHVRHAERYGYPVSVLICRLKGYLTSDVFHTLSSLVRKSDDCFRLDADEFAILMPGTAAHEAGIAGERIKKALENAPEGSGVRLEWSARELEAAHQEIA